MKTINDLKEHLEKYKDAIIIIGPGILSKDNKPKYTIEEFNENYNRKNLSRNPKILWDFFFDKIYNELDEESLSSYEALKFLVPLSSTIIDQNPNSPYSLTQAILLHGKQDIYMCQKCKTIYVPESVSEDHVCELCGKTIRPSVLLSGERYSNEEFHRIKEEFNKTHSLILIGMDYCESSLLDLIGDYDNKRALEQDLSKDAEEERIIVAIQEPEEDFNPNELAFCQFLVKDNIKDALVRLKNNFK